MTEDAGCENGEKVW